MDGNCQDKPVETGGSEVKPAKIVGSASRYVKLNVGGWLYYTTIGTLTKEDSMLRAMFSGRMDVLTDQDGWVLIDRCGKNFDVILNYLRDGSVALPACNAFVEQIMAEATYYCLQGLVRLCQNWFESCQWSEEEVKTCRVPIICAASEEKILLQSTSRPAIKLLLNRHNNKYSYTPTSDDNLLKNLELFDKLALRFNERVLFIKDVSAANEVCSWTFFGYGQKVAEVCCTSIVYAPDRKQTKVEFPEARIYEEAMNALLYENVTPTPARCADAGSPSVAVCQHCLSNVFNDEILYPQEYNQDPIFIVSQFKSQPPVCFRITCCRRIVIQTIMDEIAINSLENSNLDKVVESFKNDLDISHSKYSAKYIQSCKEVKTTRIIGPPSRYVKLNVGGCLYYTTIGTLTKEESMLRLMFSGKVDVLTDEEGWILIDRCGKYFDDVLNFLRDGKVALPACKIYVQQLLIEASHYSLNGLMRFCQNWLDSLHLSEEVVKTCRISLVNSSEEKLSLQYVRRPVIKLTVNRKHQKYSYCANAATDANLLKNLELFDKLALRFKDRILFIKDVGLSNEICSWSFYTSSQKEVQVSCTTASGSSHALALDKRQTLVECPEARIYEEAMNTLLRENVPSAPCTDAGSPLVKTCQHCLSSISSDEVNHDKATNSLKIVHGPP
ncbi:BTB/POZ domain-containing adapter for CUL3-mediated RhoA degradation protein 3 [Trichinella pseudospiralis]|uniref:BTB/POZ domain-containing adapter for CUL3-mediated RhoA degradation protein 3 n=1 Tax=Trichinella pseudospiralis TaxID=6337 RepID=A0A0V1ESY1_TRIPS|nr:BTB/POZ domain-containing adapter for CUL3-mediated RhoA degradation protein 3 [Trichinella pseudospiralis]